MKLYVADNDMWEDYEDTIKIIMQNNECSRIEAIGHINYSIKHGILYTEEGYKKTFAEYENND